MAESHQYELISIPRGYNAGQREQIGLDICNFIRQRTDDNLDAYGKRFPNYTKGYAKTIDFKIAGKSINDPDLRLSGDMLRDLRVLSHGPGFVKIGFTSGTDENDKAAWVSGKRPFLGIQPKDLNRILGRYPLNQDPREQIGPSLFDSIASGILKGLFSEPKRSD